MYQRGPYYKKANKLSSIRQSATVVVVAALFAGVGLSILPRATSAWNTHRSQNNRQERVAHRASTSKPKPANTLTAVEEPIVPPTSTMAAAVKPAASILSDLANPSKKEIAMRLVSSVENSSTDWRAQYGYIEDIGDGRGFTAGIIGFCSGTGDMLELIQYYVQIKPTANPLLAFVPALKQVNGTDSHSGLGPSFVASWKAAAADPLFQRAQDHERDRVYFDPALAQAKADGLRTLGQFMYYDAMVMHGPGEDPQSFGGLRAAVVRKVKPPSQGGDEVAFLNAFLDARKLLMRREAAHDDTSRVDTGQRTILQTGNLDLNTPLSWKVYGDPYTIAANP